MSDEVYMTRTSNALNTETERIVEATQVIVNVTKKILTTELFLQHLFVLALKMAVLTHVKKIVEDRWPVNTTDAGIFWASYPGEGSARFQISTESMLM